MSSRIIAAERIQRLNRKTARKGRYVLYWMQQSQRAELNHALEFAVQRANDLELPMLVVFALTADYPEANRRHYRFLLEGLQDVGPALARRGIGLCLQRGDPPRVVLGLSADAAEVVCDRGYLRHQRGWRSALARRAGCPVWQVESDVVVPVETASGKAEWAARTLRPKIRARMEEFVVDLRSTPLARDSTDLAGGDVDLSDPDAVLDQLRVDGSVPPVSALFRGGTGEAKRRLRQFVHRHLHAYDENRNQPQTDDVSHLSMYLHFGQISPVYIALQMRAAEPAAAAESYLEELLVRRELAHNFVFFEPHYDDYRCLPEWARRTLAAHAGDERAPLYDRRRLEEAQTHDPYWNAAMREMRHTGFMHNYMRMYWGKKILEWSASPQAAYRTALALNNEYFLDGRDPNSYANVGWIFGLHDRPWAERAIFGTVRYMSAAGLERKGDPHAYVAKVEERIAQLRA
jgi:deoxyribodipyrimidine photo-lyase